MLLGTSVVFLADAQLVVGTGYNVCLLGGGRPEPDTQPRNSNNKQCESRPRLVGYNVKEAGALWYRRQSTRTWYQSVRYWLPVFPHSRTATARDSATATHDCFAQIDRLTLQIALEVIKLCGFGLPRSLEPFKCVRTCQFQVANITRSFWNRLVKAQRQFAPTQNYLSTETVKLRQ